MRWIIRLLLGLVALSGALFSWSQFIWPPIGAYQARKPDTGWLDLIPLLIDPFNNQIYQNTPIAGWCWLLAVIALALAILSMTVLALIAMAKYLENSRVAISVLETRLTLSFADETMAESTIKRNQFIHANRRVEAYRSISGVSSPYGRNVIDSYHCESSTVARGRITKGKPLKFGDHKSLEFIELFDGPLHRNWFVTYLPNQVVFLLRELFRHTIVKRETSITQKNEYNQFDAKLRLTSVRYPITNVIIDIIFFASTAPEEGDIESFLIADNLAHPVAPSCHPDGAHIRYRFQRNALRDASLLIRWKNHPSVVQNAERLVAGGPPPTG